MNKRTLILFLLVGALAIANMWRWLASSNKSLVDHKSARAGQFSAADFTINSLMTGSDIKRHRDPFKAKALVPKEPRPAGVRKVKTPSIIVAPKTPEQLDQEAVRAELGQVRCIAVAFRNGEGRAFVTFSGRAEVVHKGDKVGSRFVVENITVYGVDVRDTHTGVVSHLQVSGT